MINIGTAVEYDLADARLHPTFGDQLAHGHSRLGIATVLDRTTQVLVEGRGRRQGAASRVVDDLGVNILVRAEHAETGTTKGTSLERLADPSLAAFRTFCRNCHR